MCFDGEPASVYHETRPRARKPHVCCECRQTIAKGTAHQYATGICDGAWFQYRTCDACVAERLRVTRLEEAAGCRGDDAVPPFGSLREVLADYARYGEPEPVRPHTPFLADTMGVRR